MDTKPTVNPFDDIHLVGPSESTPKDISSIPQWPSEPQSLTPSRIWSVTTMIFDTFLITAPVFLMVKTGLCIYAFGFDMNKSGQAGDPVSKLTTFLVYFNSQLVTLFTILFITTVATLVKRYALYRAQIGASITTLEQFQGSTTLPSTIKMTFLLKSWNSTSALLIFIWIWYYLGSQAVEREYAYSTSGPSRQVRIIYANPDRPSDFLNATTLTPMRLATMNSIFSTSVMSPGWIHGFDPNRAAISPFLNQSTSGKLLHTGNGGWFAINETARQHTQFSSTLGIVPSYWPDIYGPANFIGTYIMNSSYIFANCQQPVVGSIAAFPVGVQPEMNLAINSTSALQNGFPVIDVSLHKGTATLYSSCVLEQHHIQVQTNCDAIQCRVQQIRPDPSNKPFSTPATMFMDQNITNTLFNSLLLSSGVKTPAEVNSLTLVEANIGIGYDASKAAFVSSFELGDDARALSLSQGLSTMINGYLGSSLPDIPGISEANLSKNYLQGVIDGSIHDPSWPSTEGNGAAYHPCYLLQYIWIMVDFISCFVLLICAILSCRYRMLTVAPDIFGYISSMTRENLIIEPPEDGTALSGIDRAVLLKNVRVRIADLAEEEEKVGRIGLVRLSPKARGLRKDRLYV